MILIGKDIITGGNIIIPKLIKIDATIISITKNGKKIKKRLFLLTIQKLVLNFETSVNAGIKGLKGTSSIFFLEIRFFFLIL